MESHCSNRIGLNLVGCQNQRYNLCHLHHYRHHLCRHEEGEKREIKDKHDLKMIKRIKLGMRELMIEQDRNKMMIAT